MHKRILDLLPRRVQLQEVDYRDNLDDQDEVVQECVRTNEWYALDELLDDRFDAMLGESVDYYLAELARDIAHEFDVPVERAERFVDNYRDELTWALEERNASTPLDDLLDNTTPFVAFYRLGYDVLPGWALHADEYAEQVAVLHEALQTDGFDRDIHSLLANASYGGDVVVYFHLDPRRFVGIAPEPRFIEFTDPHVAIIDTPNGSGDDEQLVGLTLRFPFDRKNIVLDRTLHYNYTYAVCGKNAYWCEGTGVKLIQEEAS